jgi:dTDP-4-dehydrorhamnose reductase
MRILVVGASGILGTAVANAFSVDAELLTASRTGDHPVDITDPDSIAAMFDTIGTLDAIACTAGVTPFKPLPELTRDDY